MQLGTAHSEGGAAIPNILRTCTGMTVFVSHHTSSLRPLTYISEIGAALTPANKECNFKIRHTFNQHLNILGLKSIFPLHVKANYL
jgi:hypothetical protein